MTTNELLQLRSKHIEKLKAIHASADGDGFSEEQEKQFNAARSELKKLDDKLERQAFIDELERRDAGRPVNGTGDKSLDKELKSFSIQRAIQLQMNHAVDAGREKEISREFEIRSGKKPNGLYVPLSVFEKRTMSGAQLSTGGALMANDLRGDLYVDRLRSAIVMQRLGARVISGLVGDISVPRLKTSVTSGWIGDDGTGLTAADAELDLITLKPRTVGCVTEYSRNLVLQSTPDIEQLLRDDFSKNLAGAMDKAAITGAGAGSREPLGILNTDGIGSVSLSAGAPTWAKVIDLIGEVEVDDAQGTAFLTNSSAVKKMRQTAKVTSTDSHMIMDLANELAGYPLAQTNYVPKTLGVGANLSALIFGNFTDLLIGYWSAFDLLVNPYSSEAYLKGNILIRGFLSADILIRHEESFAAIQDMLTT